MTAPAKTTDTTDRKLPVPLDFGYVQQLAAQGLSKKQIALAVGTTIAEIQSHAINKDNFDLSFERGKAIGVARVTNKLYQKAVQGDSNSMMFYLKNRDQENWKDNFNHNISGSLSVSFDMNFGAPPKQPSKPDPKEIKGERVR